MMKKHIFIILFSVFTLAVLAGCGFVSDGPFGWVYTDHTVPVALGEAESGSKEGRACIYSILGMLSFGDGSIDAAMRDGKIERPYTINKESLSILGSYSQQCTVVRGV